MAHSAAREVKRTDTGRPVPSPNVKTVPREVVTRNVPRRIKVSSRNRSNRSIGRHRYLHPRVTGFVPPPTNAPDEQRLAFNQSSAASATQTYARQAVLAKVTIPR